jgi:hypothetical protein
VISPPAKMISSPSRIRLWDRHSVAGTTSASAAPGARAAAASAR